MYYDDNKDTNNHEQRKINPLLNKPAWLIRGTDLIDRIKRSG